MEYEEISLMRQEQKDKTFLCSHTLKYTMDNEETTRETLLTVAGQIT